MSRLRPFGAAGAALALALFGWAGEAVAQAQPAVISGMVTTQYGDPLPNARVFIEELNIGAITGPSGAYTLTVPGERTLGQQVELRAQSFGWRHASVGIVLAAGEHSQNFQLDVDPHRLDAVVVTGVLGGREAAKVPFSVGRLDASDLVVPATNPLSQLQGKVPGALVVSASGRPGSSPAILLRGPTALNAVGRSQEPLYIVDGVPVVGRLPDINSLDIESMEVVKGAAASSLYGVQGGNGVIQITTRRGTSSADGVTFRARTEVGFGDVAADFGIARNHALMLDETGTRFCSGVGCARTFDYDEVVNIINNAPGFWAADPPSLPVDPGASASGPFLKQRFQKETWPGPTYNAVESFLRPQPFQMSSLDVSGRRDQTSFFASVSYLDEGGAIRFLEGRQRVTGRVNVDQQVGSDLNIGLSTFYMRSTEDGGQFEEGGRAFFRLTRQPAKANLLQRNQQGDLFIRPNLQNSGIQNENPAYWLEHALREDLRDRFIGGLNVRYAPLDWLDVTSQVSYDVARNTFEQFRDKGFRSTAATAPGTLHLGFLNQGAARQEGLHSGVNAVATRRVGSDLVTRFSAGYSFQKTTTDTRSMTGTELAAQGVRSAANAGTISSIASSRTDRRLISGSGGIELDYLDRYVVDLTVRRDGSSLFGADNRWDTYGRGSAAWLLAREPWFNLSPVSELTLRGSYGTAGGVPNFAAQYETFSVSGGTINFGTMGNRNLRPEKMFEIEIGADVELFNRLMLSVTHAVTEARDQILPVTVPAAQGFSQQWQNAGTVENKTWEVSLAMPIVQSRDFNWLARVNWDQTRTLITKLNVPPFNMGTNLQATGSMFRVEEGLHFGTFFGRHFIEGCGQMPSALQASCGAGREFQVNDEGYVVWVGEGNSWTQGITDNLWNTSAMGPWGVELHWGMPIILREDDCLSEPTPSCPAQVVELGKSLPDFTFSVSQDVSYKRLSLYALMDAQVGQRIWNQSRHWAHLDFLAKATDQGGKDVDTAKPIGYYFRTGPPDFNAATVGGFYDQLEPNSHFVENASFAKLRELSASYRVGPISGVGDWHVSVVGRNLFTITNYTGFDPETGIEGTGANSQAASAAVNRVDAFNFPSIRTITFGVTTTF